MVRLTDVPTSTRPIVKAAIKTVEAVAPRAEAVAYRMAQPSSKSMMWKLVRYAKDGKPVLGIGTFTAHSAIFFYRGRELDDGSGLLKGSGKDTRFVTLLTPADAGKPAVKRLIRAAFKLGESTA